MEASITVLRNLPKSELCLSLLRRCIFFFFFCPGDQFVSLLPSQLLNKSKVIEWVMFRVSACVNILVLAMQFSKMNSVLEGKTLWF